MHHFNVITRTNKRGIDRALFHCRAIGTGFHALRDAALYLLRHEHAEESDIIRLYRGSLKMFVGSTTVGTAAGVAA